RKRGFTHSSRRMRILSSARRPVRETAVPGHDPVTNSLQELVQRETSGRVIDEHLDRNPCSLETWAPDNWSGLTQTTSRSLCRRSSLIAPRLQHPAAVIAS